MNETPTWNELFEIITERLPKRIRFLRDLHNYTQEYLALRLGISQTSYGNLENNKTTITLDKISLIAEVYNLTINEFFEFDITYILTKNKIKI